MWRNIANEGKLSMKCPNCGKEMKDIYHNVVSLGDEPDYDSVYHYCSECKKCKIKYYPYKKEWEIPEEFKPTEKQKRTVMFIINRIFTDDNPLLTKKQYSEFINRYFEDAKKLNYHMNMKTNHLILMIFVERVT